MKRFRTLYLIDYSDYFYGVMIVCASTRKATLKYFICLENDVHEFGDGDNFERWESHIRSVVYKAQGIADENNFVLWTY